MDSLSLCYIKKILAFLCAVHLSFFVEQFLAERVDWAGYPYRWTLLLETGSRMLLILDGNSEHVAHALKKLGVLERETPNL